MKKLPQSWLKSLICLFFVGGLLLVGCSETPVNSSQNSPNEAAETPTSDAPTTQANMENYTPRLEGKATVEMKINGSPVLIEVDGENAPVTAGNFVDLVERGFYNGLTFHRVVKDPEPFVVQGGDPQGVGTGGFVDPQTKKSRYVPLEIKLQDQEKPTYSKAVGRQASVKLPHTRGAVAMARSQMPDSASSQFYFALSDLDFLNGDYAVFGYVTQGMEAVDGITQGDRIESAKVVSGAENLQK